MKYWLAILVCVLAVCILAGCDARKRWTARERPDVVDRDFTALITKTDNPYVFGIEIKKVNPKANKKIGGLGGCVVDLVLRDSSGRVVSADVIEITDVLGSLKPPVDSLKGKVRLIRGLPLGTYVVQPRVRIQEVGKDAVRGHLYADGGTVAVPAGNSVKVRVKEPWLVKPVRDPKDVIDRDFMATIAPTKTPYVYEVEVKRVNDKVDKSINNHSEVFVDLELVNSKGMTIAGDFCIQTFAEYVGDGFGPEDEKPYLTGKKGRVRLVTSGLPAGKYVVKPVVRIPEEGKDRLLNPRADQGSVAVPAGNSIQVEIR
ncbi:MAG: hypothetical protein A2Z18_07930 [Armatimonadetes bacterium RBG_16_58_9]|nr:MAG: hypothetical protein A2Z18_07930 [Armatimonadetes bacterium RBG_16_58_9]